MPRDHWLEPWERHAILDYFDAHPLDGYRRLSFMMLDDDVVAVSLGPLLTRMPSGMNPSGGIARRDVLEPNEELRKGVVERHMELFSAMRRPSLGYS